MELRHFVIFKEINELFSLVLREEADERSQEVLGLTWDALFRKVQFRIEPFILSFKQLFRLLQGFETIQNRHVNIQEEERNGLQR